VDDLGTGYSSLACLRDLPVDILKLDRAFVSGIDTDPRVVGIARAIADMATTLDLAVVVEGIEEPAQLAALQNLASWLGQGYQFAPPMPAEAVPDCLTTAWAAGSGGGTPHRDVVRTELREGGVGGSCCSLCPWTAGVASG
jgi:diguanylate cyclase